MVDFSESYNRLMREVIRTDDMFSSKYITDLLTSIRENKTENVTEIKDILSILEVLIMFSNTSKNDEIKEDLVELYKGFLLRYYVKKNPEVVLSFVTEAM